MRRLSLAVIFLTAGIAAGQGDSPAERALHYTPRSAQETEAWQQELRTKLADLLHLSDLVAQQAAIPLNPEKIDGPPPPSLDFSLTHFEIQSTPGRKIKVALAIPAGAPPSAPAIVAIHGHGGNRMSAYNPDEPIYKQFGKALALHGFVVASVDVGRHEVYEEGRTLMGERLWDLMRCVDFLQSLDGVDPERIGCAGLSLGGEMAMWLGAMDPRVRATVSAGFLTRMDQMEQNHCMCWKFDGLRELVDFADLYAMTAPRALQCQNGLLEPETQFTVPLALEAVREILPAYEALGAPDKLQLLVHGGAHEIALESLISFAGTQLAARP